MFKSFITASTLITEEPTLQKYIDEGAMNLDLILSTAEDHVINDLNNRRIQLKRINTPLALVNNTVSGKDEVERKRFVINVTAIENTCIATLKGCNTTTGTFNTIFNDIVIDSIGEVSRIIKEPYLYYKLELSNTTNLTYSAYMIETSFDLVITYYALYLAYKQLIVLSSDVYNNQAIFYLEEYKQSLESLVYSYNEILDSDIAEDEIYNKGSFSCMR